MRSADGRFRAARSSREHRPVPRWALGVGAAAVVVAAVIALGASDVDGYGPAEHQSKRDLAATAARQAGSTCVGWPLSLMPSTSPEPVDGTVTLWADREAFRLRNAGAGPVEVEIEVGGGTVQSKTGGTAAGPNALRFELAAGAEGAFTMSCAADTMTATIAPVGIDFALADGLAPSPLRVDKQRSG